MIHTCTVRRRVQSRATAYNSDAPNGRRRLIGAANQMLLHTNVAVACISQKSKKLRLHHTLHAFCALDAMTVREHERENTPRASPATLPTTTPSATQWRPLTAAPAPGAPAPDTASPVSTAQPRLLPSPAARVTSRQRRPDYCVETVVVAVDVVGGRERASG